MENKKYEIMTYRTQLMGLAALFIYVFHEWIPLAPNVPILGPVELFVHKTGFFGVDIFFLLSGLGLVYAFEKHSLAEFYKRRYVRILPPYVISAVIFMAVKGWPLETFLKNLFGISFFTENIYAILWFVPAIAVLYLLFPLYYLPLKKLDRPLILTGAALVLWFVLTRLSEGHLRYDLYGFTNRIPVFLMGILVGYLLKHRKPKIPRLTWLFGIPIFIAGLAAAYYTTYCGGYLLVPASNCCLPNFLMALGGVLIFAEIFRLLDVGGGRAGKGILGLLRFFGTISLEFYCMQEFVGGLVKGALNGRLWDSATNAVVILAVTAAALGLHYICKGILTGSSFIFGRLVTKSKKTEG